MTGGPTVGEFLELVRRIEQEYLRIIGQSLAPEINRRLAEIDHGSKAKPGPKDYCPGCGELCAEAPDLCAECSALNAK